MSVANSKARGPPEGTALVNSTGVPPMAERTIGPLGGAPSSTAPRQQKFFYIILGGD